MLIPTKTFAIPTDEQLAALDTYVDLTGCSLISLGLDAPQIKVAFLAMFSGGCKWISVDDSLEEGRARFMNIAQQLLSYLPAIIPQF